MKYSCVLLLACVGVTVAHIDSLELPGPPGFPVRTIFDLHHRLRRQVASGEATAAINDQNLKIQPDGNFEYNYETGNGISAKATGVPKNVEGSNPPEIAESIQGSYSWTSPEGKLITVTYTADENGYHPQVTL